MEWDLEGCVNKELFLEQPVRLGTQRAAVSITHHQQQPAMMGSCCREHFSIPSRYALMMLKTRLCWS